MLRIAAISPDGRTITTRQRVQYNHYGEEYKAEVALLSRRILFTTDSTYVGSSLGVLALSQPCLVTLLVSHVAPGVVRHMLLQPVCSWLLLVMP